MMKEERKNNNIGFKGVEFVFKKLYNENDFENNKQH
jgi:hypothetical protein